MKKIVLPLILILFGTTILSGCTKDEILNHYNNVVQSAGSIELTGNSVRKIMELTIIQEPIKLTIKPVQEQSICLEEPQ